MHIASGVNCSAPLQLHVCSLCEASRPGLTLLPSHCPTPTAAECALMASLRHPNVVLFLGVVYTPPAVVTEYCQRGRRL